MADSCLLLLLPINLNCEAMASKHTFKQLNGSILRIKNYELMLYLEALCTTFKCLTFKSYTSLGCLTACSMESNDRQLWDFKTLF